MVILVTCCLILMFYIGIDSWFSYNVLLLTIAWHKTLPCVLVIFCIWIQCNCIGHWTTETTATCFLAIILPQGEYLQTQFVDVITYYLSGLNIQFNPYHTYNQFDQIYFIPVVRAHLHYYKQFSISQNILVFYNSILRHQNIPLNLKLFWYSMILSISIIIDPPGSDPKVNANI